MFNHFLLPIVFILTIGQLYKKYKSKHDYDVFIIMLTGVCMYFTSIPETDMEIAFSTVVCLPYVILLIDFIFVTPIKKHREKNALKY